MNGSFLVNHIIHITGWNNDLRLNSLESAVIICRIEEDKPLRFPDFKLSVNDLTVSNEVGYLGQLITDQRTDDDKQCQMMRAQANNLLQV